MERNDALLKWLRTSRYYCKANGIPLPADIDAAIKDTLDLANASAQYSADLMEALHNYADGSMGMVDARNDFRQAMTEAFSSAFDAGYADGGGDPEHMTSAALDWLYARQQEETQNILDLFRTLKEQMSADPPVDIGAWISDRSGGYNQTLADIYSMGTIFGKGDEVLTFDGDDGDESCETCQQLKGTSMPASEVAAQDLFPYRGNTNFECGGWHCRHGWKDANGNWVTADPNVFKSLVSIKDTSKPAKKLPPQLAEDPGKANVVWLKDHDPRIGIFKTGKDPDGKKMTAYLVAGDSIRSNLWQDFVDGGNHGRYPWIPLNDYWLDIANADIIEYDYNLIHETVEDRKIKDDGLDYEHAHADFANPAEYKARQSSHEDVIKTLEKLGWEVPYVDIADRESH